MISIILKYLRVSYRNDAPLSMNTFVVFPNTKDIYTWQIIKIRKLTLIH